VFSGDVRREVFLFLPLVCLVRTGSGEISCKFLLGHFEGVVARDLRIDIELESTVKALSMEELDSDIFVSLEVLQCGFLTKKMRTPEYDPSLVEKFQLPRSQRWHFYYGSVQNLTKLKPTNFTVRVTVHPSP
jgi:hypothetical protein